MFEITLAPEFALMFSLVASSVVALIAKQGASSGLKGLLMVGLATLLAVIDGILKTGSVLTQETLSNGLLLWGSGVLGYYGLLKPIQLPQRVANKTSSFGLGQNSSSNEELELYVQEHLDRGEIYGFGSDEELPG